MVRFWLLAPLVLAACVQSGGSQRFFGGEVVITPPAGYCVKQTAQRASDGRAMALLGRCTASGKAEAALIALTLGEKGSGQALAQGSAAMARHLQSPQGRASLARDGRAASVRLGPMERKAGQLVFHVEDRSSGPHWRALFALKGRLASLSVQDPSGAPLAKGQALLHATLNALQKANGGVENGG